MRRLGRSTDLLGRCLALAAIGDICGDRVVEEHNILADQRDVVAQAVQTNIRQRMAINPDFAAVQYKKTGKQIGGGGLAAARRADQRHRFTGSNGQ